MANLIQAIRGMNDILPSETPLWQYVEANLREVLTRYGYHEIRFPVLEKTELFKRSIGEATDIVEKEMYTFTDRNQESLSLRPEGTACCVRAGLEHGLFYNQIQKLWYLGPYFRHERPQKGRYRQFHQLGAEVFGLEGPDIDAELILLSARILDQLKLTPYVNLQVNSLGSLPARQRYRACLVDYFNAHLDLLDEDSLRRLQTNPLRILDTKNPAMAEVIANAPSLIDYLDEASDDHFKKLLSYLDEIGLAYTINPRLVRGLDYYSKTVFEWVTHELGAQGTVCAGGRYDGLVDHLGGKNTPALGFALGIERVVLLIQQTQAILPPSHPHIYFITDGDLALKQALKISEQFRRIKNVRVLVHFGGGSMKNQFKKADKLGALFAMIIGEKELSENKVAVKFLKENKTQIYCDPDRLSSIINEILPDVDR